MSVNDFILNCEKENKQFRKDIEYYKRKNTRLTQENKKYKEVINKAIKHVSSLSSRGRDCMIYADVKKDILDILKEVEHEKSNN